MEQKHKLKKVHESKNKNDQPHRLLNEMELPEGTEFTTDDSSGMVTIRINKVKDEQQ